MERGVGVGGGGNTRGHRGSGGPVESILRTKKAIVHSSE